MSTPAVGRIDPETSRELRRSVLRPELAADAPLPGDDNPAAVHFGVTVDGRVVSTCMIWPEDCPWRPDDRPGWRLRQMATDPAQRGHGYAGRVVEAAKEYAREHGGAVLWCNARELAIPMYARHGFVGEGEIFTDDVHTIPHQHMWVSIGRAG